MKKTINNNTMQTKMELEAGRNVSKGVNADNTRLQEIMNNPSYSLAHQD